MNTPGTIHITSKMVAHTEDVSRSHAYKKIRQAFDNLPKKRATKTAKITIIEYCDFFGFDLGDYVKAMNQSCKMNIIYETKP